MFEVALDFVLEANLRTFDTLQLGTALSIGQVETDIRLVIADRKLVGVADDHGLGTMDPTQDWMLCRSSFSIRIPASCISVTRRVPRVPSPEELRFQRTRCASREPPRPTSTSVSVACSRGSSVSFSSKGLRNGGWLCSNPVLTGTTSNTVGRCSSGRSHDGSVRYCADCCSQYSASLESSGLDTCTG